MTSRARGPRPDRRAVFTQSTARDESDARCVLACLQRLLARRRRLDELGLCAAHSPCAWHRNALDRAIVSYLLLAEELELVRQADALLVVGGASISP